MGTLYFSLYRKETETQSEEIQPVRSLSSHEVIRKIPIPVPIVRNQSAVCSS